jgi:small-conductance mechanosensitive channel
MLARITRCLFVLCSIATTEILSGNAQHEPLAQHTMPTEKITALQSHITTLNQTINQENIWVKKYSNYTTYRNIAKRLETIDTELKKLQRYKKTTKRLEQIKILEKERQPLLEQMDLLKEYEESPYKTLMQTEEISEIPEITNPLAILFAFSFIKQVDHQKEYYESNYKQLEDLLVILHEKKELLTELYKHNHTQSIQESLKTTVAMIDELDSQRRIFATTLDVYRKKVEELKINLTDHITSQGKKTAIIGTVIFVLLMLSLAIKIMTKKYISDNERLYTVNKIVNFTTYTLIVLVLLFAYLENVSYLVTVLGFASAGLAIAMKDWFMSTLGWLVIILGGSIHVGDRIKVIKDGAVYVGDVLDVSLLRITLHEDVTLTSYRQNRRAGRIIFIPNNYIFTTLISNYSHASMKTVWDGIDITVTFDSDFKKAMHLCREITKRYSKGYTDITRKQLNKLRDRYSLRNTNVEPKILSFIESNGIRISTWYLTNAFATLTLRSTISGEIIEAFHQEENIQIAYPTTTVKDGGPSNLPLSDGSATQDT